MNQKPDKDRYDNLASFEQVIKETVSKLDSGREQLFTIAEKARQECSTLEKKLLVITSQIKEIDEELSRLKNKQANVKTDGFSDWSKEIRKRADVLTERINQLGGTRINFERDLQDSLARAEKAEKMISQMSMIMDFVWGNLSEINVKADNLQQAQNLSLHIIRAHEEERRRMARDIHDGPAQSMANVVLRIEFCEKLLEIEPERIRDELNDLKNVVKNNLQDVRKIIFDLRPMALDDLGLAPALKRYVDNFRENNEIDVKFKFYGRDCRLEPAFEIVVFRLIQEALNNVLKHAEAALVIVSLEMKSDYAMVTVEDDGKGFDVSKYVFDQHNQHFGLISMRERTNLLGGEMELKSTEGKGTKISFRLPVNQVSRS